MFFKHDCRACGRGKLAWRSVSINVIMSHDEVLRKTGKKLLYPVDGGRGQLGCRKDSALNR